MHLINKPTKHVTNLAVIVLITLSGLLGYLYGFIDGTGTMPFVKAQEILPPQELILVTSTEVDKFVESSDVKANQYDIGFNCVEFALLAARDAHWQGISATPVRIDFTDGTAHMVLGFPTSDSGWRFWQIEGSTWLNLSIGSRFLDKTVESVYFLQDFIWTEIVNES